MTLKLTLTLTLQEANLTSHCMMLSMCVVWQVADPRMQVEAGNARAIVDAIAQLCIQDDAAAKLPTV